MSACLLEGEYDAWTSVVPVLQQSLEDTCISTHNFFLSFFLFFPIWRFHQAAEFMILLELENSWVMSAHKHKVMHHDLLWRFLRIQYFVDSVWYQPLYRLLLSE